MKEPAKLEAIRYYLKNLYFQNLILKLKEKEPAVYRDLMGVFDVFGFDNPGSQTTDVGGSFDLSAFMGDTPGGDTIVDLGAASVQDEFFSSSLKLVNPLGMYIKMRNAGVDTSGHVFVDASLESFELTDVRTPNLFAEALLSASSAETSISLMSMLYKIDDIAEVIGNSNFRDAVNRVKADAYRAVLTAGNNQNPNFATLLNAWIRVKHAENEVFINEVRQFLNYIVR